MTRITPPIQISSSTANSLISKILTKTRDLTSASGDVAYTGFGFQPTSLDISYTVDGSTNGYSGSSYSDSSKTGSGLFRLAADDTNYTTNLIFAGAGTNYQVAIIKSYDADGFTLTWTKTNSPTGTLQMVIRAIR